MSFDITYREKSKASAQLSCSIEGGAHAHRKTAPLARSRLELTVFYVWQRPLATTVQFRVYRSPLAPLSVSCGEPLKKSDPNYASATRIFRGGAGIIRGPRWSPEWNNDLLLGGFCDRWRCGRPLPSDLGGCIGRGIAMVHHVTIGRGVKAIRVEISRKRKISRCYVSLFIFFLLKKNKRMRNYLFNNLTYFNFVYSIDCLSYNYVLFIL